MNEDIESKLIEFVQSTSAIETAIECETDLLTTNVLDSLMLMDLVMLIEDTWGIQLQGDDIAPASFRTVGSLARLIGDRRSALCREQRIA